jgi:hypothetical protein
MRRFRADAGTHDRDRADKEKDTGVDQPRKVAPHQPNLARLLAFHVLPQE